MHSSNKSKAADLFDYFENAGIDQFSEWLNKENIEIKDINISSRVLTHWEAKGIIPLVNRRSKYKTRRYSLIELVWLGIVIKLRDFGLSLEQLSNVKESISNPEVVKKWFQSLPDGRKIILSLGRYGKSTNHSLESAIYEAYIVREPIFLITDAAGKAQIIQRNQLVTMLNKESMPDSILININTILQAVFPHKNLEPIGLPDDVDTTQLVQLIGLLYNSDATRAELRMKEGHTKMIELTKQEDIESDLRQLLGKHDYQDISITLEKGERQRIKRIEKIKF